MGPSSIETSGIRPPRRSAKAASAEANSAPKSSSRAAATAVALATGSQRSLLTPPRERMPFQAQPTPVTAASKKPSGLSRTPGQVRLPCRASAPSRMAERIASVDGHAESRRAGTTRRARQPMAQTTVQGRAVRRAARAATYAATTAGTTATSRPGPMPSPRSSAAARPAKRAATRVAVRTGAASAGRTSAGHTGAAEALARAAAHACCCCCCACQACHAAASRGTPAGGPVSYTHAGRAGESPAVAGRAGESPAVPSALAAALGLGWASSAPLVLSDIGFPSPAGRPGVPVGRRGNRVGR